MARLAYAQILWISLLAAACGGGGGIAAPDADIATDNARLVIQGMDPVGLGYGDTRALRVRYETVDGAPITGAPVDFAVQAGPLESTGGSTLSAMTATTDDGGFARVEVTAGAEPAAFRVVASAANAPAATFTVLVSNDGFASLELEPIHDGFRLDGELPRVEIRLYRPARYRCADISPDAVPDWILPPRTLPGFGGTAVYQTLTAGEGYTIVAWAAAEDGTVPLAFGCVDLAAAQVPATRVRLQVVVADRAVRLESTFELRSTLDLGPLADALAYSGIDRPWQRLACDAGPGQLLLDCALDALGSDGALDCAVDGDDSLALAIAGSRGEPNASGCRPSVLGGGEDSLDQRLTDASAAGAGFPSGAALDALVAGRAELTAAAVLESELEVLAGGAAARHRLTRLEIQAGTGSVTLELATTARPVLEQLQVPVAREPARIGLGDHGFTLRYGSAAYPAFADLVAAPAGLAPDGLGTALAGSIDDGQSEPGCASLSALVCAEAGQPATCLESACVQAATYLDGAFTAWAEALDGDGLDLRLAGSAPLYDVDGDLVVDSVGTDILGNANGSWVTAFTLADGTTVDASGDLGTTSVVEP